MLERDMSKRESIIGKRHDSTIDRSLNVFDQKRAKGSTPMPEMEVVINNYATCSYICLIKLLNLFFFTNSQ